jgi:hypothetical protein
VLALLARRDYTPDFVTPPPESPLGSIEDDLERIRATAARHVRREVSVVAERSRVPELHAFLEHPRREARRLADVLGVHAIVDAYERGSSPRPAAASASRWFSYTRPSTSLPSRRRHTQPAGASMTRPTPQA